MIKKLLYPMLAAGLMTACFGDGDRDEAWSRERTVIGPIAIKSRVVYVDTARDKVITVETKSGSPTVQSTSIGRNAIFALPTPDRNHLAVLTRGEEALKVGQENQEPHLWIVNVDEPQLPGQSFAIGSPFDRLALSKDGSAAVAYYSAGGFDEASGVFRNPNEIAVVDLTAPASDSNPVLRTIRSFGAAPDGIVLSPPMSIPGASDPSPRTFALILSQDTITMLDVNHPERREVSIRLGVSSSDKVVHPRELVFAPNTATMYLRSDNAADVLSIQVVGEEPVDESDNDYQPILAELGAGGGPSDVAVYDDAIGRRYVLAAMPTRGKVAIIDADTAQFVTVNTPDPIDRIVLFPSASDIPPRFALLASLSSQIPRVHILALDTIDDQLTPIDLTTVNLAEPVLDVIEIPGVEKAMIVHDADRTVLGLLDLALGAVSPLEGVGRLDSFGFSEDGKTLIGITGEAKRVGFLDLSSLHPSNLRIDDTPSKVFALSNGAVWVDHNDVFGLGTFIPSAQAKREDAVLVSGFLLDGYLDEEY